MPVVNFVIVEWSRPNDNFDSFTGLLCFLCYCLVHTSSLCKVHAAASWTKLVCTLSKFIRSSLLTSTFLFILGKLLFKLQISLPLNVFKDLLLLVFIEHAFVEATTSCLGFCYFRSFTNSWFQLRPFVIVWWITDSLAEEWLWLVTFLVLHVLSMLHWLLVDVWKAIHHLVFKSKSTSRSWIRKATVVYLLDSLSTSCSSLIPNINVLFIFIITKPSTFVTSKSTSSRYSTTLIGLSIQWFISSIHTKILALLSYTLGPSWWTQVWFSRWF